MHRERRNVTRQPPRAEQQREGEGESQSEEFAAVLGCNPAPALREEAARRPASATPGPRARAAAQPMTATSCILTATQSLLALWRLGKISSSHTRLCGYFPCIKRLPDYQATRFLQLTAPSANLQPLGNKVCSPEVPEAEWKLQQRARYFPLALASARFFPQDGIFPCSVVYFSCSCLCFTA